MAIVFVFLLLAAMYESWRLPWAVLLGSPLVALGAFFGVWLVGLRQQRLRPDRDSIMLIGLAAKNAILIVEFAKAETRARASRRQEAALEAARLRFRPILMTAFAFILGVVPLMRASGAGAGAQNVMGTAVFWGMLVATFLGVFIIPGNFAFVEQLGRRHQAGERPGGSAHDCRARTGSGSERSGRTSDRGLIGLTLRPWRVHGRRRLPPAGGHAAVAVPRARSAAPREPGSLGRSARGGRYSRTRSSSG